MKLVCNVSIGNRHVPMLPINRKQKSAKSTLALCKHPKKDTYYIIFFNNQNKNGTKYEVNGNISKILTKFLNEGKATVQFKEPPHDFYIQADVIPLQCFLHTLKRALLGSITDKELTCSSLSVTPVSLKNIPPKKLVIKERSEYPTKGFPRTLESLYINDVNRCSLDLGILKLTKLRILDLSNNCIEFLPIEFGNLPNLCELNLSYNLFGKSSPKQWMWIDRILSRNLKLLNLSHNNLTFLPSNFVKLCNLLTLNVDNNQLKSLPSGIGNLVNLKTFSASHNLLQSLPGSVKRWKLDNIDISHNQFSIRRPQSPAVFKKPYQTCTLKEYAAKTVLFHRLYYTKGTLPATVLQFLESANYCICGKACFDIFIIRFDSLLLSSLSKNYVHNLETTAIPTDFYLCSMRCSHDARTRYPFT